MGVLEELQPQKVFGFFEELCRIPHGTFDIQRISDHCVAFAKERGLEVVQDEAGNVIIRKPGTEGYENSAPVILQGHMDMVCEKRPESDHDFKKDPLQIYVEDGFVKAKDTTLGGDNGIAVAMAMAVLDSDDIAHPPLEVLITADEEVGMGGAKTVDLYQLKGSRLINIDSEEEGILTAGCAGGIQYEAEFPLTRTSENGVIVSVRIHGLCGGHSGMEIHKQRGNGHKMMGRFLRKAYLDTPFRLISIDGGSKDNVISMDVTAKVLVSETEAAQKITDLLLKMKEIWDHEFMGEEPNLAVEASFLEGEAMAATFRETESVIQYLVLVPNGMIEYSRKLEGIVETSLNLGIVETKEASVRTAHLLRSSVESRKEQLKEELDQCVTASGGTPCVTSEYPAWQFQLHSELRDIMVASFRELYGKEPEVSMVHAGLECGIFVGNRPDLDCVSFGPDMFDVHSFQERLSIASTQRTWKYLKTILKNCR